MTKFSGGNALRRVKIDQSLPRLGSSTSLFSDLSSVGSLRYGRLFTGTPRDPGWAPHRRAPQRPPANRLILPLHGHMQSTVGGASRNGVAEPGDVLYMPWGQEAQVKCLDEPTVFAVLELPVPPEPRGVAVRFLFRPVSVDHDRYPGVVSCGLIRARLVPGVNLMFSHTFAPGGKLSVVRAPQHTLLIGIGGTFTVTCRYRREQHTRGFGRFSRVVLPPGYSYELASQEPRGGNVATILQLSFL